MPLNVAIIGFSFRLPNTTQETFWNDLLEGRNLVTSVPEERWSQETFIHPRKDHPGTSYTFTAGSVGDVSLFDAGFFGISPREAAVMDPQQRLLLELGWEAFENAGVKPSSLKGSNCGVFVGISNVDYSFRLIDNLEAVDSSSGTGNTSSIAANRLSYFFDLHGPSMAIDTACSSSLVAFHQACASIAAGESSTALAGGVSLHLHPYTFIAFSKASMLSRKGHCNVFDAACDGYVRSEGAGLFLLKEYNQAVADGDRILAVVAASAVNTDGRKSGLTVPSAAAQASLLRQAYQQAGIAPSEIDYVEAHGTGTAVGDPIEVQAIGEALGTQRPTENPLIIGSVKSNLGHLESAAGVAGLTKALLCIQNRTIPATIGITKLNPAIPFTDLNIEVATESRPITKTGEIIVGVNSFGFGGANAHIVLKSHEHPVGNPARLSLCQLPLVLSAKSAEALKKSARDTAAYLNSNHHIPLYDIAYNALFRRELFKYKTVVFGNSHTEIAEQLYTFADTETTQTSTPLAMATGPVFVYSGNGAQWFGMGKQLLTDPLFLQAVQEVDSLFRQYADWSLEKELSGFYGIDQYADTEIAQPALFAIQVGITRMLQARGVSPLAVVGHSVGEVAAAWACGALTLEDAVQVIYHRSQLQGTTKGKGQMTAVGLGQSEATQVLTELGLHENLTVAGSNSNKGATVAGADADLKKLESALSRKNIFNKRLALDYAFHSPAMDPLETGIKSALATIVPQPSSIPFYSTVTGGLIDGAGLDAGYWWHNLRKPVLFDQTIRQLLHDGNAVFIEIGPHAILRSYLQDCMEENTTAGRVISTGMRGDDSPAKILTAVGQAIISGIPIDWNCFFPEQAVFVELPHYPWQRESHWHPVTPESYGLLKRHKLHPLLGYKLAQQELTWENQLDTQLIPMLADHQVGDAIVFPGAGFVELALAAAHAWLAGEYSEIEEIEIKSPLLLKADRSKLIRVSIDPGHGVLRIKAKELASDDPWEVHVTARVLQGPPAAVQLQHQISLPARTPDFTATEHYQLTEAAGLGYGPAFQAIDVGWIENNSVVALFSDATPPDEADVLGFHLHPAHLDCAFQLIFQLLKGQLAGNAGIAYIPVYMGRVSLYTPQRTPKRARATLLRRSPHSLTAECIIADDEGTPIAAVQEVRFKAVRLNINQTATKAAFLAYHSIPWPHPLTPCGRSPLPFDKLKKEVGGAVSRAVLKGTHRCYSEEVDPLLDVLCSRFTLETVRSLADGNQVLSHAIIQEIQKKKPETALYLTHLLSLAVSDGSLTENESGFTIQGKENDTISAQDIWNSLFHDHPEYFPVIHSVSQVGLHLKSIITEQDASRLLPSPASLALLTRNLLGTAAKIKIEDSLQKLLTTTLATLPEGSRFGVMEVSDGLPLFASTICKNIAFDRCQYLFATGNHDITDEAAQQLEHFPAAEVRLLASTDEFEQPAPAAAYHLAIIMSDFLTIDAALHAIDAALSQLAPDGLILFIDQHPSRWADFVFGSHTAWWHASASGSPLSRQQSPAFWQMKLEQRGLGDSECHELSPRTSSGPYLLLARRAETVCTSAPPLLLSAEPPWLVIADKEGYSRELGQRLDSRLSSVGGQVLHTTYTSVTDLTDELEQIKTLHGGVRGIIHISGLQPPLTDTSPSAFLEVQTDRCALAAAIIKATEATEISTICWLVTGNAACHLIPRHHQKQTGCSVTSLPDAALWGFGRTLINETASGTVRLVDLETAGNLDRLAEAIAKEIIQPDNEQEICISSAGKRFAPRLQLVPALPDSADAQQTPSATPCYRLGFRFPGQLRNLRWEPCAAPAPKGGEIEVEVHATGLNFRDFMYTLGLLSDEAVENGFAGPTLGMEFSGTVTRVGEQVQEFSPGDHLVGFGPACFANRVITSPNAVSLIPAGLSFEAAVTIPATFFTSFYALHYLARLSPGEKVLIHGAAGGVGIAAIQVARWCGAEIYATAGTDEKRDFLRMLGIEHIFDSRSLTFAAEILAQTGGTGVDVVLNSLSGEAINRNLQVLRPFGRFLELGKRDYYENTRIGLRPFRNNISYFGIDADQLMQERPDLTRTLFKQIMALFAEGVFHPLPFHTFEADDIVNAFRYMQQSRQIGKIVVTYNNGITATQTDDTPAQGSLALPADATFLITGGLSGFGLKTAQWLVQKGVRNLVLVSRSGPVSDEALNAITSLQQAGVTVHAAACDVTSREALSVLLAEIAKTLPPLRGIVHAAMVIHDGLIQTMERDQIRQVFAPKILGAAYLHELTLPLSLDYFILFSSATTLFGNPGQGNYVAANYWLEAFAASRESAGLPVTCVSWSPISDTGYLARNQQVKDALQSRLGGEALSSAAALDLLEKLLLGKRSGLGVLDLDWKTLSRSLPSADSPKFMELTRQVGISNEHQEHKLDIRQLLQQLPEAELLSTFIDLLKQEVGTVLRIDPAKIDQDRVLSDMGLDSLMGVELAVALESLCGIKVPVMVLTDSPTITKLASYLLAQLFSAQDAPDSNNGHDLLDQVQQALYQHGADLADDMVEELVTQVHDAASDDKRMIQ
jgi:acyl transferase domain-containing protein/NADPH:quinone reductase-like Zn-dependent oxidoreductase/NAD(P)-dependent dehydrogenase (short-subunit alcohol dehydrogenase family)/acyl carrier protein